MGGIESVSLANKFGIGLGCLVCAAFLSGLLKLYLKKRRLNQRRNLVQERKICPTPREIYQRRKQSRLVEGDLFGVRALRASIFGGVSRSRHGSMVSPPTAAVLSPNSDRKDWSQDEKQLDTFVSTNQAQSEKRGKVSAPQQSYLSVALVDTPHMKGRPSTLSMSSTTLRAYVPSNDSLRSSYDISVSSYLPAVNSYLPGNYMAPLPSPESGRSFVSSTSEATSGWASPSEANFYKTTSVNTLSDARPTSYLPRLNFASEVSRNGLITSTPVESMLGRKSVVPSILSSEIFSEPTLPPKVRDHPKYGSKASPYGLSSQISYARGQGSRSIFPRGDVDDMPESSRKKNNAWKQRSASPLSERLSSVGSFSNFESPETLIVLENQDHSNDKTGTAVIRDSIVSKRTISVYDPEQDHLSDSGSESSVYSIPDSVIDDDSLPPISRKSSKRSQSTSTPYNHSRQTSYDRRRSHSTHALARARNSLINRYSKDTSNNPIASQKRQSRSRDRIYNDRSESKRTRFSFTESQHENLNQQLHDSIFSTPHSRSPSRTSRRTHDRSSSKDSIGALYDSYYEPKDIKMLMGMDCSSKPTLPQNSPKNSKRNSKRISMKNSMRNSMRNSMSGNVRSSMGSWKSHVPFSTSNPREKNEETRPSALRHLRWQEDNHPNMF